MSSYKQKNSTKFLQKKRSLKSTEPVIFKQQILNTKIGPWDQQEDIKLKQWVKENGPYNWTKCAEFMENRTAKQCREHWKNTIDEKLIKGQWTAEEDLLIMKFYKKYESWRKMIPIFENRTENSIKNRFFSQLRKIVVKKRKPSGRKEYGTKYGLETLKNFLEEGIKQAEKKYYEENKDITKTDFENYMNQIENSIKNRKKGQKFINLKSLKRKNSIFKYKNKDNYINIDEEEEEKNQLSDYEDKKDENIETFNNTKNKRGRTKGNKTIFKTIKKTEELNTRDTREETTNFNNLMNFNKKKSKKIYDKIMNETDIIKEQNEKEKEKEKEKSNDNIFTKKSSKVIENKNIIERKNSKINGTRKNDNFPDPNEHWVSFRAIEPPKDLPYKKAPSIVLSNNEFEKPKEKKNYNNYQNQTTNNIKIIKKGKNINPTSIFQSNDFSDSNFTFNV